MSRIEMTESEWLHHLQHARPDVARAIFRVGLIVEGVRKFPPRRFVAIPNSPPASPEKQ